MPKVGGRRVPTLINIEKIAQSQIAIIRFPIVHTKSRCSDKGRQLVLDIRKCFYPNTAMKLQDINKLAIQSYIKAAKYYGVSHLIAFQQHQSKMFVRFIKIGGGQMMFRLINYCRMKDIYKNGGQPFNFSLTQPLIILNNFTQNNQMRQISRSIQDMFPNINLNQINLSNIKRVISFTYQINKKFIYFRHYKIICKSKSYQNKFYQLTNKAFQNLSTYRSFSQYLNQFNNQQQNNDQMQQGNDNQRQVKLVQIGPRMKLKFIVFKQGVGKVQDEEDVEEEGREEDKEEKRELKGKNNQVNNDEMEGEQEQEQDKESRQVSEQKIHKQERKSKKKRQN